MHKDAGDLKPRDCFLMAGQGYEVLETYELDDPEYIKFSFTPILGPGRFWMTVLKDLLFSTL